jgi:hypothetical protein
VGSRQVIKSIAICIILIVVMTGCENNKEESSALSGVADSDQITDNSLRVNNSGNSSELTMSSEDIDKDMKLISLPERIKELGLDIPLKYVEAIEKETNLPIESYAYLTYYTDEDKDYAPSVGLEILEHDQFYIVHLNLNGWTYDQKNEYHVFQNGEYTGMLGFEVPKHEEERFEKYDNHVWMVVDVYDGHGMGGPAFSRTRQVWFEISNPDLNVALTFVSRLNGMWMYPEHQTQYSSDFIKSSVETYGDNKERFLVTLDWNERIYIDWKGEETDLFIENGAVQYAYSDEHNSFYKLSDGILIGNNIFSAKQASDMQGITNDIYNDPDTMYGRDKYNLLLTYRGHMIDMSESGSEAQIEWLHDFLDSFEELDKISELYLWHEK